MTLTTVAWRQVCGWGGRRGAPALLLAVSSGHHCLRVANMKDPCEAPGGCALRDAGRGALTPMGHTPPCAHDLRPGRVYPKGG